MNWGVGDSVGCRGERSGRGDSTAKVEAGSTSSGAGFVLTQTGSGRYDVVATASRKAFESAGRASANPPPLTTAPALLGSVPVGLTDVAMERAAESCEEGCERFSEQPEICESARPRLPGHCDTAALEQLDPFESARLLAGPGSPGLCDATVVTALEQLENCDSARFMGPVDPASP